MDTDRPRASGRHRVRCPRANRSICCGTRKLSCANNLFDCGLYFRVCGPCVAVESGTFTRPVPIRSVDLSAGQTVIWLIRDCLSPPGFSAQLRPILQATLRVGWRKDCEELGKSIRRHRKETAPTLGERGSGPYQVVCRENFTR